MSPIRFLLLLLCLSLSPLCIRSITEAEALLAFKKSLSNAESLDSWKPESDPCKWEGVFCAKGKGEIRRIHLTKMSLSGNIDVNTLMEVKNLISLSLSNNSFEGHIPPFNLLKDLKALYISANKFSGEIPGDYFRDTTLRRIWLSDNEFSGKIPNSLGKLAGLNAIHLERNRFTGLIPDISQATVTELDVSGNELEGQVPVSMERFGAESFKENSGVCGKLVGKECVDERKKSSNLKVTISVIVGIVVVMVSLLVVSAVIKSKDGANGEFNAFGKEPVEEVVEVRVQGSSKGGVGGGGGDGSGDSNGGDCSKKSTDSSQRKVVVSKEVKKGLNKGRVPGWVILL